MMLFWLRCTRDIQKYDAKNRLLIPDLSSEKLMAEIYRSIPIRELWTKNPRKIRKISIWEYRGASYVYKKSKTKIHT